ncbi:MAG: NADH-quinone oxidoreductase subunit J [candidate division Zixibacteria bacterium CG_4_9_14_3_um_filter_46_8]|nr:MAG: NADH-quinone oxidoreductase subunit J [candidate division Zixibacteria bacterium CG_4_9_14_3_um_filter_46_8]
METGIFYILAAIILTSALMVVSLRNIFHSALMLILCFFAVAGLYITLDADFLAAVQVLIYVGAVTILMIFAVMVTHQLTGTTMRQVNEQPIPAALIIIVLFILLAIAITQTGFEVIGKFPLMPTVAAIGTALMTVYVLPFEIVSLVLLVALIGAIIIARRD